MSLRFTVPKTQNNWAVRDVLRAAGVSSTAIRRAKRTAPGILANGAPVHTDVRVAAGTVLELPAVPESAPNVSPEDIPLQVVWEDENAALVQKPAGMPVHPTLGYAGGTLANAWLGLLARRAAAQPDGAAGHMAGSGSQPGVTQAGFHPVWRLDKDTSGLLLLAKSAAVQPFLLRSCRKLYAAVLRGAPPAAQGTVAAPIGRAPDSIIRRQVDAGGDAALTHYKVLLTGGGYSLAVFRLETGRTHQIRVHMAHLGCPVAGDTLYSTGDPGFVRQALHCAAVTFCLPGYDAPLRFLCPMPEQLLAAAGLEQGAAALQAYFAAGDWMQPPG